MPVMVLMGLIEVINDSENDSYAPSQDFLEGVDLLALMHKIAQKLHS